MISSRSLEDLDVVFSKRSTPIEYDNYLPKLPEGWLNTSMLKLLTCSLEVEPMC
jgi:hypothetical protein